MSVSRRHVLTVGSTAVLPLIGDCSSLSTSTETSTQTPQSPILARLLGPDTDQVFFRQADVVSVGSVREHNAQFSVPITLSDEVVADIPELFNSVGVVENPASFEVALFERNREITRFGISPGLATEISDGNWSGTLQLQFEQQTTADAVQRRFVRGADIFPVIRPEKSFDSIRGFTSQSVSLI